MMTCVHGRRARLFTEIQPILLDIHATVYLWRRGQIMRPLPPPTPPTKPSNLRVRQASIVDVAADLSKESSPPPLPSRPRADSAQSAASVVEVFKGEPTLELDSLNLNDQSRSTQASPLDWHRAGRHGPVLPNHLNIPRGGKGYRAVGVAGESLLLAANTLLSCWNVASGDNLWNLAIGNDTPLSLLCSGSDICLLGTYGGNLLTIDVKAGYVRKTISLGGSPLTHLLSRGREQVWAIDDAGWVNVWRLDDQGEVRAENKAGILQIIERPQKAHVTDAGQLWVSIGTLLEIHQKTDQGFKLIGRFDLRQDLGIALASNVIAFVSFKDDKLVTVHTDGLLMMWNTANCHPVKTYKCGDYRICSATSFKENLWLGMTSGIMMIVDVEMMQVVAEWRAHQTAVTHISLSQGAPNPLYLPMVSVCDSSCAYVWDGHCQSFHIDKMLRTQASRFTCSRMIKVRICSWNVDSNTPPDEDDFWRNWIGPNDVDILVFGLQEIIDLESKSNTAKLLLNSNSRLNAKLGTLNNTTLQVDEAKARMWTDYIKMMLKSLIPEMICIKTENMVGLMLAVFVREGTNISHVSANMVKTGLAGLHGNKGAIITRLLIDDSSVCFVNCHLAAGHSQSMARNNDLTSIFRSARLNNVASLPASFLGPNEGGRILDHEHCILFGDLNYRLNISREGAELGSKHGHFGKLMLHDQLQYQVMNTFAHPLGTFREGPLTFPPTYKYDPGRDTFDSSEKQRVPAYCDRILIRSYGQRPAEILNYASHQEMKISDHRPVSATIQLEIKKIGHVERERVRSEIHQAWLNSV